MEKKTFQQSMALISAELPEERHTLFVEFGFTEEEAKQMIEGSSLVDAYNRLGGVWRVGNVEWL